jgi:hypothetical protein
MHALCRHNVLLSRQLLSQAVSLHPLPGVANVVRLLLPKTAAVYSLCVFASVSRRLLPETVSAVLLARE